MTLYGDKPIRKYPALVGHAPPEVESAIRESYDMIYQQQAIIDRMKTQLAEALRKSNPVVIRQSLQANGSTPLSARMLVGGSSLLENPVHVGPIRDPLNPPRFTIDFEGFELGGTLRDTEEIYFKRSTLDVNRIELAMAKNNGVLTITGNRIIEASEFGAGDWRIGECMGAGLSLAGEDLNGEMHLVYGGATASSVGETSGRSYMAQMQSTGFRYPWFCDENARFGFRDWTAAPVCLIKCDSGGSGTSCVDVLGRDLAALNGLTADYILHNITDGSYARSTSVSGDTITCSGGLSGGSDNTFAEGDLVFVYSRSMWGYDFISSTGATTTYTKRLCWGLGHTSDNNTSLALGVNGNSRGMLLLAADTTAESGNRAGILGLYGEDGSPSFVFLDANNNLRLHTSDPSTDDTLGDQIMAINDAVSGTPGGTADYAKVKAGAGYIYIPYYASVT